MATITSHARSVLLVLSFSLRSSDAARSRVASSTVASPEEGSDVTKPSMVTWQNVGLAKGPPMGNSSENSQVEGGKKWEGVRNLGKKCWLAREGQTGPFDICRGGPCPYCGDGLCCKKGSFRGGCDGSSGGAKRHVCVPAPPDPTAPMNLGKECWKAGDCRSGRCGYCGSGLCCKKGRAEAGCDGSVGGVKDHECVVFGAFQAPMAFSSTAMHEQTLSNIALLWPTPAEAAGVLNVGDECGGANGCDGGPCRFCGSTGFCCKKGSFRGGCDGLNGGSEYTCTSAPPRATAPKNMGKECWNAADCRSGRCGYCGSGLCCKRGLAEGGCDGEAGGEKDHECVAFQAFSYDHFTEPEAPAEATSDGLHHVLGGAEPEHAADDLPSPDQVWNAQAVGLLNKGKHCWGVWDAEHGAGGCRGGPCSFCGSGFCCRYGSYRGGCDGFSGGDAFVCTPAPLTPTAPMNLGKECWTAGDCRSGRCGYCGSGLCCKMGKKEGGCDGELGGAKNHVCVVFDAFNHDDFVDLQKTTSEAPWKMNVEEDLDQEGSFSNAEFPDQPEADLPNVELWWNPQATVYGQRAVDLANYYAKFYDIPIEAAQQKVMQEYPEQFERPEAPGAAKP